jgi:uncharacterized protein (TIGR03545 family)
MTTAETPAPLPPPDKSPFTPRWSAVLPALAVTGLVAAFVTFFLDGIVERSLEKAATAAHGARVELDGVDISFLKTSVVLSRLQVTDPDAPMSNLLEVARMTFKLDPKPLAWKKILIQDASIDGIRTGTPRRTSGALAPKKAAADEGPGLAEKAAALGAAGWDNLKAKYDPRKIQAEDLASYRKVKEEQVHLKALADTWGSRVDAVQAADVEKRVKSLSDRVKSESFQGLEGVKKAQDMLKEAKTIRQDVKASADGFKSLKVDLQAEIDRAKGSLKEIDALRKQDVDGALGGIKEAVSVGGVTEGLLGPAYSAKIRRTLGTVRKVRAMIPEKKAGANPPPPPPRAGKKIHFPFRHNWPAFHLLKAGLSGETGNGRAYTGTLQDATSDPKMLGRPVVLRLKGQKSREFALAATLDYTKDVPREALDFLYGGIPLAGMKLGDAGGPVTVSSGTGRVTADVQVRGEALSGTVAFLAEPVVLSHALSPEQAGNRLMVLLHDVLGGLTRADVTFHLSDTLDSPNIRLESSLDGQIKDAVKEAVQKELDALRAQAAERVASLVDGEKAKLEALVNGRAGETLQKMGLKDKQIEKAEAALQKALDDLQKKGAASVLPAGEDGKPKLPGDLKKLFKRK